MNTVQNQLNYKKVFSVNGILQAAALQNALELAGIPSALSVSRCADLDILVPADCVYDAQNLLAPEHRTGEIYFVPAIS